MEKEEIKNDGAKKELENKLTPKEKKLLSKVLREKTIALKERARKQASNFKKEVKKALLTAFLAAFGFLIALEWREVISQIVQKAESVSPVQGQLISAILVTIIAVLGIILTTRLFKENEEEKKG